MCGWCLKKRPTVSLCSVCVLLNINGASSLMSTNWLVAAVWNSMAIKVVLYNVYFIAPCQRTWMNVFLYAAQKIKWKQKNGSNHEAKKSIVPHSQKKNKTVSLKVPRFMVHHTHEYNDTHAHFRKKAKCINVYRHAAVWLNRKYRKDEHTRKPTTKKPQQ